MGDSEPKIRSLARLAFEASRKIESEGPDSFHVLISCSKTKGTHRDLARNLYESPLYRKSVLTAEGWGVPFSILSAKFGLLRPEDTIEPYDVTLKGASKAFKKDWANRVVAQIRTEIDQKKTLIALAGDDYLQPILEASDPAPLNYYAPMKGLSLGTRLSFLNLSIKLEKREDELAKAYKAFEVISRRIGLYHLRDLLDTELPKQGVYFFFDAGESTKYSTTIPRLVRIGTHGVSAGSTATLRNRLRTHLGTRAGLGNHRASVFRLHVGRAIIERDGLHDQFPNWGKGQSAEKAITEQEVFLEKAVSEYVGALLVLYTPISDSSGTTSLRALVETQFIALFSENMCPLETPSSVWLGRYSDKPTIREIGLWNIRDVGSEYDLKFMPFFEGLSSKTTLSGDGS